MSGAPVSSAVAWPPAPPNAPPEKPPIPAVLATVITLLVLAGLVALRLLYTSRHALGTTPSSLAVTGTRWCRPGEWSGRGVRRRAALFAFRFAIAVWQLGVFTSLIVKHATGASPRHWWLPVYYQLFFFTVWNYMLQGVFWTAAATASAASLLSASGPSAMLRRLVHRLLSVCLPMSVLVSVVLWAVLFPQTLRDHDPHEDLNFYSYNMHAANTLLLLTEGAVDRLLLGGFSLVLCLTWALTFAVFSFVVHAHTGFWPYFFMDLSTYAALYWYPIVVLVIVLAWGLVALLSRCKAARMPALVEEPTGPQPLLVGLAERIS